jgi:hypothetical protein
MEKLVLHIQKFWAKSADFWQDRWNEFMRYAGEEKLEKPI